jgi:two-component system cell cycle sensor histidine kinase/response regulator CckA
MHNSIRTRLTAAFIGLAIGPLLLVGTILAWQSFTTQERQALNVQREVAQRVAAEVRTFFEGLENELHLVSRAQASPGLSRNEQRNILTLLMSQHAVGDLILLDSQGQEQIHLSRLSLTPTDLGEYAGADEFIIPQTSGEIYYSPVRFDEVTGEPSMTIAVPLLDVRTGTADGVLVSEIRVKEIWDLIADIRVSPGQSIYIVDSQNRVVAHRDPSVVLRGTHFDVPDQDGIQPGLTGSAVVLAVETTRFGQQEFNIIAEQDTSEALVLAINTVVITAIVVAAALAISAASGLLVVRQIIQPIHAMATTAQAISAGDLSRQVEVTSRDELGLLALAFNDMTTRLQALISDLEQQIAERKRAEEALRESARKLEDAQALGRVGNWEFDIESQEIIWSDQTYRLYERDPALGPPTAEEEAAYYSPEQARMLREYFSRATAEKKDFQYDLEAELPGGRRVHLTAKMHPVEDEHGRVVKLFGTVQDITERKKAEQALRESEERLRQIASSLWEVIWLRDAQTRQVLYVNPAFEELTGRTCESFYEKQDLMIDAIHPDDREWMIEALDQRYEGVPFEKEHRIIHLDGSVRWVSSRSFPVRNEAGEVYRWASVMEDITERKRAEEALRESEERFRQVLESLQDVAYRRNLQTDTYDYMSPAQLHVSGYTAEEMLSTPTAWVVDRIHPDDLDHVVRALEESMAGGQRSLHVEYRFKCKDGQYRWMSDLSTVVWDAQGCPLYRIGTVRDITERKRAEEERERLLAQIQEQALRVQQIVDTVPEGVILIDTEHRTVLANPMGKRDLNTLASAQVGDVLTHLGGCPLAEILTSPPKGLWHELTLGNRSFQIIARPMEDGPEPKGWVLVIRDVTQQREVERRIQQQERLVAVGQLAAGIAHDFNNVMAVISLYTGMVLRTPGLPEKTYARLETVKQQAGRASTLIQQVLDFSRRAVLERSPTDMLIFLKEQSELLRRILPENIKIDLTYGKDEYVVRADPTRIQQAIVNLVTNARDAMPEGGQLHIGLDRIHVQDRSSAPLPEMEIGDWVRVTVADTGTGIPPDVMKHIFDPFFTTKPPGQGTGLGLSQVYGTIKQHDGYIDVSTTVGEGTTFALYLPAVSMEQTATPPRPQALTAGQGQTILVIEDEAATRKAIVDSLELLGYQVLEAANGQKALTVFEQHEGQIDLVLSDIVMPEMGGKALFLALKQQYPGVKVVLMSGHPLEATEIETLLADGLSDWLPKPPTLEQLAQVMAQVLAADTRQSEPSGSKSTESE